MSTIFTKIINKEIPAYIIYEDEFVMAFLDISQATPGHTLLIPKNSAKDIFDLPEASAAHLFKVAQKLAAAMKKSLNLSGLNILSNNGQVAGQTVFHFHLHLIPRYEENELSFHFTNHSQELKDTDYKKRAMLITSALL